MTTEFTSQSGKSVPLKIRRKLSVVNGSGMRRSALLLASGSVLKVLLIWMTNG
jgi:hypothetical protein